MFGILRTTLAPFRPMNLRIRITLMLGVDLLATPMDLVLAPAMALNTVEAPDVGRGTQVLAIAIAVFVGGVSDLAALSELSEYFVSVIVLAVVSITTTPCTASFSAPIVP